MAMTICSKCGRQFSDERDACPFCGTSRTDGGFVEMEVFEEVSPAEAEPQTDSFTDEFSADLNNEPVQPEPETEVYQEPEAVNAFEPEPEEEVTPEVTVTPEEEVIPEADTVAAEEVFTEPEETVFEPVTEPEQPVEEAEESFDVIIEDEEPVTEEPVAETEDEPAPAFKKPEAEVQKPRPEQQARPQPQQYIPNNNNYQRPQTAQQNTNVMAIAATVLFALAVFFRIIFMARYGTQALTLMFLLYPIVLAVGSFMVSMDRKNIIVLAVGCGLMALTGLWNFIAVLRTYHALSFYNYGLFYRLLAEVPAFFRLASGIAALVFVIMMLPGVDKEGWKKLWFLPGVLFVIVLFAMFFQYTVYKSYSFIILFELIFTAAGLFTIFLYLAGEEAQGVPKANPAFNPAGAAPVRKSPVNTAPAREAGPAPAADSGVSLVSADAVDRIKYMKELYDEGILTKEEFDQKKKELLGL